MVVAANFGPPFHDLCVDVSDLHDSDHEEHCANDFAKIDEDPHRSVRQKTPILPHSRTWISNFAHIDEENRHGTQHTKHIRRTYIVNRAEHLPMSPRPSTDSLSVAELQHVRQKNPCDQRVQSVKQIRKRFWYFIPSDLQKNSNQDRPASGTHQAWYRKTQRAYSWTRALPVGLHDGLLFHALYIRNHSFHIFFSERLHTMQILNRKWA